MATIGLFSQTPYGLQQERQAALSKAADAYGQTNPNDPYGFDRARSSLYMAGSQLGGGIAGLLGAEDPEMKKASDLDSILKTSELTTPEGWLAVARKLADLGYGKETQEALAKSQELKAAALEAQVKQSTVFKNMDTATPEMRNAAGVASSVAKPGTPEWNAAYTAKLDELASKEGTVQKVGLAKGTEKAVYRDKNGQFIYTQDAEGKQVRVPYNGGVDQTTSKTTISPQIRIPADVNALASGYENAIKDDVSVMNLAGTAKGLINQAAKSNNPTAWESARTQVAKAVGEGKLSNEDIARTGIDPTLIGGVRDWIEKKTVGVPDANTQKALFVVASYLEKNASGRVAEKRNNRIKMAKQVNPDIDAESMFPDYSKAAPPVGGGGTIVDFKDFGKKAP